MWIFGCISILFALFRTQTGQLVLVTVTPRQRTETNQSYLVDLPDCRIPNGPLFPDVVLRYWRTDYTPSCPSTLNTVLISDDKILTLDPSILSNSSITGCCYQDIYRPEFQESDWFTLSKKCYPLDKSSSIDVSKIEFLLVTCNTTDGNQTGSFLDFHHNLIDTNPRVVKKLKYWETKSEPEKPLNIMIVIIDSVSRTHALRSLPKTMEYLTKNLNFVDFKGYHCVGEPSSVNYIPMTLGIVGSDFSARRSPKGKYDHEPFVYRNFSRSQYLTLQLEDMANYNVFNFNGRTGFTKKPYDFYIRPYILAHEQLAKYRNCMNSKNIYDFLLGYTVEFLEKFAEIPKYTTTYFSWPNHDYFYGTLPMDGSFLKYFQKIEELGVYNNTVVFVLADHGYRSATKYAESKYGLLERNLPMFLVKLPQVFIDKYPEASANLNMNSQRLTSHLDFYKTIVHLHQLMLGKENAENASYGYNMEYGQSLLKKIPVNRTCEDAQIPERFCSCNFPLFDENFEYEKYRKPLKG